MSASYTIGQTKDARDQGNLLTCKLIRIAHAVPAVGDGGCAPAGRCRGKGSSARIISPPATVVCSALQKELASNLTGESIAILPAVMAGIGGSGAETSWRGAGRSFSAAVNPVPSYQIVTPAATVCVDTDSDGCATPTARALSATATGPVFTFANPFAQLRFFYRDPRTGHLVSMGTASATFADNGVTNTRTWTYAGVNFNPPAGYPAGTVFNVFAIGADLSGRGLISAAVSFTQVAD